MNDKRITLITPTGRPIYKAMTNSGRPGFCLDVIYTLEDGSTQAAHVTAERKKNVLEPLERDRVAAANGSMTATYGADGEFYGTCTRYDIGATGLVPRPAEPTAQPIAA